MDKDRRIAELEAEVVELKRLLAKALDEIARLKRNSRTSSKPPSSDIVKPPKSDAAGGGKKRTAGGQPGHARHTRTPFAAEQVDAAYEYDWAEPGDDWQPLDDFYVLQQVERRENPLIVTEHRFRRYRHRATGKIVTAPVPEDLRRQGLIGPRLRATTAWLKGQGHMAYQPLQGFLSRRAGVESQHGTVGQDRRANAARRWLNPTPGCVRSWPTSR